MSFSGSPSSRTGKRLMRFMCDSFDCKATAMLAVVVGKCSLPLNWIQVRIEEKDSQKEARKTFRHYCPNCAFRIRNLLDNTPDGFPPNQGDNLEND